MSVVVQIHLPDDLRRFLEVKIELTELTVEELIIELLRRAQEKELGR